MAHQLLEIAPGGGLAAGEVNLQGAEGRGLVDDALPDRGAQLVAGGGKLQRIGAIGALQRAAVGQLGQDRQGRGQGFVHLPFPDGVFAHIRTIPFWVSSPTRAWTSAAMVSRRRIIAGGERVDDGAQAGLAVAEAQDLQRRLIGHDDALGRQHHPAIPCRVEFQTHPGGQARQGILRGIGHDETLDALAAAASGTKAPGGTWPGST